MNVRWTAYGTADLIGIRNHIAEHSAHYANAVVDRILTRVTHLEVFPESGQMVPEYGRNDIREVLVHSYRIIHHVLPSEVRILTVVHGSMLLPAMPPIEGEHTMD